MPDPAAAPADPLPRRYRFADLELDSGQRRVFRDGEPIRLARLSYEFLRVLVEAAPNLVSHSQIATRVWGLRRTVTPENLTQRLLMLRQSLGDDATRPTYIETVRSQGCRLIPAVEIVSVAPVSARGSGARDSFRSGARRLSLGMLSAVLAGLVIAIGVVSWNRGPPAALATAGSDVPAPAEILPGSIAVLRFERLNAEPEEAAFFAEAMHARLVNTLGTSADLTVIGRASVLQYSDSELPLREIAGELRVSLIVAGTIRYLNDRVDVIAELLAADTGIQLWSKSYDMLPDDLFVIEHDIARGVAHAVSASLPSDRVNGSDPAPTSFEAFAFYTRAMDVFNNDRLGARSTANTYLDQAIALDASFAHAYAGKALVEAYAMINSGDVYERSSASVAEREHVVRNLAAAALALNPETDLAFYALGILDLFSWRWRSAHDNFERALELTPQHPVFLSQLGWLEVCGLGRAEGIRLARRGAILGSRDPYVQRLFSDVLECSGDMPAALAATQQALEVDTTSFASRMNRAFRIARVQGAEAAVAELDNLQPLLTRQRVLSLPAVALAYRRLGRTEQARALFERFTDFANERRTGPANWYLAYLAVDDYDSAYSMLKQAVEQPGPGPGFYTLVAFMRNDGSTVPFNEPRFVELRDQLRAAREL